MMPTIEKNHQVRPAYIIGFALVVLFAGMVVVVPRFYGPGPHHTPAELADNYLMQLRNAIESFHSDTGAFPTTLLDLVAADGAKVKAKIDPRKYKGPYLTTRGGIAGTGIPKNPLVAAGDNDIGHHWRYDPQTGVVEKR